MKKYNTVVFIGTDGTGKTTVSEKLILRLKENQFRYNIQYVYLGMKNYKLNITSFFEGKGFFKNIIFKYFIYPFDLFFKKKDFQADTLYIIDRIPSYPFLRKNTLLKKIYSFVLPKINYIIWLYGTPGIILKRKNELNIERLDYDQKKIEKVYKNINANNKRKICIDLLTPEEIVTNLLKEIKI